VSAETRWTLAANGRRNAVTGKSFKGELAIPRHQVAGGVAVKAALSTESIEINFSVPIRTAVSKPVDRFA
jgi:hypothetical protein